MPHKDPYKDSSTGDFTPRKKAQNQRHVINELNINKKIKKIINNLRKNENRVIYHDSALHLYISRNTSPERTLKQVTHLRDIYSEFILGFGSLPYFSFCEKM